MNNNNPKSYREFIENDDFIFWILTEDNTLQEIWDDYIKQTPELLDEFKRAIDICKKTKAKGDKLDAVERNNLLLSIKQSSSTMIKQKKLRLFSAYVAAVCALLIISLSIIFLDKQDEFKNRDYLLSSLDQADDRQGDVYIISGSSQRQIRTDETLVQTQEGDILIGENDKIKSSDLNSEYITLVVPKGKRSMIKFSDGSTAWVNSGSKVIYPKIFGDKTRDIVIDGEVYVDVVKMEGKSFIVHTKDMDIKVLGTQFNVNAYSDEMTKSVVLVEGSVNVSHNSKKNNLSPNQGFFVESDVTSVKEVDVYKYICWKEGVLLFEDEPFSLLLRKLSRYYGVRIDLDPSLDNLKFEGKLNLKESLDDVLKNLSLSKPFSYRVENNTVYINK